MLSHWINSRLIASAILAGAVGIGPAAAQNLPEFNPPPDGGQAVDENYEALTRGPLHEAFANPYDSRPEAGVVIPKEPPEPIEEVPPESAPAGENVVWIPGYWGWEPDGQNFLWISGLWRDVPPDRRWVPGYWNEVQDGYQWIAGFWASAEERELSYLPTPPESLERGPNVAPPEGDYFWSPGCWMWIENDYQWRPGYWAAAHEHWVWVPDHYTWTPYGCVFISGYWDHDFTHRGTLFSPVRFARLDPGFRYVPRVTINLRTVLVHFFVSRPYHHYHYGDYYAVNDSSFGIVPWITYERRPNGYDPLLTYYQWNYGRRGVNLTNRLAAWNQYYVQHEELRPPRTFRAQRQFVTRFEGRENVPVAQSVFARPLQELVSSKEGRRRFRPVSEDVRQQVVQSTQQFQRIRQQRASLEGAQARQETPRREPGQERRQARAERTLELPQTVTALKPLQAAEQPQQRDAEDTRRPGQPGAERPGREPSPRRPDRVPPPARPRQDGERPGTRPQDGERRPGQQRPERPDQRRPETRPDQQRPERPDQRQPGQRPEQQTPETRPGQQPQPGTRDGEAGRRIPRFNFRRQERPQQQQPGQQAEPRNRRGFDAVPPGQRGREQRRGPQAPGARGQQQRPQPGAQPQPNPRGERPQQGAQPQPNPRGERPQQGGPPQPRANPRGERPQQAGPPQGGKPRGERPPQAGKGGGKPPGKDDKKPGKKGD